MSTPNHSPSSPSLAKLSLGTAPDSWGVWFPRDDHQVGWEQYLDEVALAGYLYTELGPQGFLPQDPGQLRDELAKRNLTVTGGTVFAGLHKGPTRSTPPRRASGARRSCCARSAPSTWCTCPTSTPTCTAAR